MYHFHSCFQSYDPLSSTYNGNQNEIISPSDVINNSPSSNQAVNQSSSWISSNSNNVNNNSNNNNHTNTGDCSGSSGGVGVGGGGGGDGDGDGDGDSVNSNSIKDTKGPLFIDRNPTFLQRHSTHTQHLNKPNNNRIEKRRHQQQQHQQQQQQQQQIHQSSEFFDSFFDCPAFPESTKETYSAINSDSNPDNGDGMDTPTLDDADLLSLNCEMVGEDDCLNISAEGESISFMGDGFKGPKKCLDKGSDEYKRRRERNNVAVRKSREKAKQRSRETEKKVMELQNETENLRRRVEELSGKMMVLRRLLDNVGVSKEYIDDEIARSFHEINGSGFSIDKQADCKPQMY